MTGEKQRGDRHRRLRWRSPERETERCDYMRELQWASPLLTLNQIALAVKQRYGTEYEGAKPMDHSTIWWHLKGKCTHRRTASTAPATKSPGAT